MGLHTRHQQPQQRHNGAAANSVDNQARANGSYVCTQSMARLDKKRGRLATGEGAASCRPGPFARRRRDRRKSRSAQGSSSRLARRFATNARYCRYPTVCTMDQYPFGKASVSRLCACSASDIVGNRKSTLPFSRTKPPSASIALLSPPPRLTRRGVSSARRRRAEPVYSIASWYVTPGAWAIWTPEPW